MLNLTDQNYDNVVNENELVLVDFYADWCNPCKMLHPILEEVKKQFPEVVFAKANVEDCEKKTLKNRIQNVPCVLLYKNGEVVDRIAGLSKKEIYTNHIKKTLLNEA